MELNLQNQEHAYLIGLLQTDGSHYESTRNRGKITLELGKKDSDIIEKLSILIGDDAKISQRIRNTNYSQDYESTLLTICNLNIRTQLKPYIPVGKKTDIICKPNNILESDYWRGIIDGDGSLGLTSNNIPFLSLVTKSELLANDFIDYIEKITGQRKTTTKNKRDLAYNICVTKEIAQSLAKELYYNDCLCLNRKLDKANDIISWVRPNEMKKVTWERKKWTSDEDIFISTHSISESIEILGRTEKSIQIRLSRIKN